MESTLENISSAHTPEWPHLSQDAERLVANRQPLAAPKCVAVVVANRFPHAVGLPTERSVPRHIHDFDPAALSRRRLVTGEHCFGCTAGHGSSCGGALI